MSSIVGHIAAGFAAYAAFKPLEGQQSRRLLPVFVFLAICPDFDYFGVWWFGIVPAPRITHSLLFGLTTASLTWWLTVRYDRKALARMPLVAFLAASLSHPLLDLLTGAHPVPLLWPLPDPDVALSFGVLPSAGRLALGNYYLWRNLLIELAVLLPVLAFLVTAARRTSFRPIAKWLFAFAPIWLAFVAWSVSLPR